MNVHYIIFRISRLNGTCQNDLLILEIFQQYKFFIFYKKSNKYIRQPKLRVHK